MENTNKYDDIINLPHHTSQKRPRMSAIDRAAQFSPFAALTGYEDAVEETARLTDKKVELTEESKLILNEKLQMILERISEEMLVTFTFFEPDKKKEGGAYIKRTGVVKCIDSIERTVVLIDKTQIPIDSIWDIGFE